MVWEFRYNDIDIDWVSGNNISEACRVIMQSTGLTYQELRRATHIRKLSEKELDDYTVWDEGITRLEDPNPPIFTFREYIRKWGVGDYVATTVT